MHRLEQELYNLVEQDTEIFSFIEKACLDGMWYWDIEDPDHEWMSSNFWLTLGYDPSGKQHLASEWQDIINQEDLSLAFDNFQKHCADPTHPYDQIVRYKHKDGHTVWVRCVGIAIRDENGNAKRMLGAHTDLTELKESEEKLRHTIDMREKFFARMSHEIRTPLHGIIGLADILKKEKDDIAPAELEGKIDTIASCGEQLLTLLDDLLTLGTITEGKLQTSLEGAYIGPIIEFVYNLYRPRAIDKGLKFELILSNAIKQSLVVTDRTRITQVISNIVSNAIKFTESGTVTIEVKEIDTMIVVDVSDTGCGIKDTRSVFDAYYRERHSSEHSGSGLGLEIVQRLCAQLNHDITVVSEQGSGSKFSVSITKADERTQITSPEDIQHSFIDDYIDKKLGRVLIVDDNDINQEILASMIKPNCETLLIAHNGKEAIELVNKVGKFDLILMDLHMPIKDGYQAASEILSIKNCHSTRIIAVSADAYPETIERCKQSGMHTHLKKPFTRSKLFEVLG